MSDPSLIIDVLPIGGAVKLFDDIPAVITAICIRHGGVTYEVCWWDGRTRRTEWLSPPELIVYEAMKVPVRCGLRGE